MFPVAVPTIPPLMLVARSQHRQRAYEIQIDDMGFNVDTGQNFSPLHQTGAVYALAPSSKIASKPAGQWNTFEIEATNTLIKVTLNGQLVTNYSIPANNSAPSRGPHRLAQRHTGNVQFQNVIVLYPTSSSAR